MTEQAPSKAKLINDMSRFVIVELPAPATHEQRQQIAQRIASALERDRCDRCDGSGELVKNDSGGDPAHDYSIPCPECSAGEPPAVHSDAVNAARNALTADTNVTYPSRVSARHIRHVLRELLAEHVRLHTLYQATCATYCREHEAASSQPPLPARVERMEAALRKIARWHNEFPPTGRTWDGGSPMSYAALYGSNGERDYMRQVALDALKERPTATKGPSPPAKTASAFAGKVDDEPSFFTDSTGAIDFGPASPEAKGAIYTSGLTLTDEDKKDILGDDQ